MIVVVKFAQRILQKATEKHGVTRYIPKDKIQTEWPSRIKNTFKTEINKRRNAGLTQSKLEKFM